MNNIIQYIIELNLAITFLFLVYIVLFRKDSNFRNRRAFLFTAMVISAIVPLIKFSIYQAAFIPETIMIELEELTVLASSSGSVSSSGLSFLSIVSLAYLAIVASLLGKLVLNLFFVGMHVLKAKKRLIDGVRIHESRRLHASSIFNIIFLDPENLPEDEKNLILKHELSHVKLMHSSDRLLTEFILALSWLNPVAWLLRKSVIVNHEYQADDRVISLGTDQISYQLSILNQYIGSASLTNQFNSQIKNRIKMLNKNYKKGSFWKSMMLIPLSALLLMVISCEDKPQVAEDSIVAESDLKYASSEGEEMVYTEVDEMPVWSGEEDLIMAIRKHIAKNIQYPGEANLNGVQGKVFVQFLITKSGVVVVPDASQMPPPKAGNEAEEVVVVAYRTLNEGDTMPDEQYVSLLKKEAKRVVESIPALVPAKIKGEAVNVMFTMPIVFRLQ